MVSANIVKRPREVVIDGESRPVGQDLVVEVNIYGKRVIPAPVIATAIGTKTLKLDQDVKEKSPFLPAFINCVSYVKNSMKASYTLSEAGKDWMSRIQSDLAGYFVLETFNDMRFVAVGNHDIRFRLEDDEDSSWQRPFSFSVYYNEGASSELGINPNYKQNKDRGILYPKPDIVRSSTSPLKAINKISENIEVTNMFIHKFGADIDNYMNARLEENSASIMQELLS